MSKSKPTVTPPETQHAHDDDELIVVPRGEGSKFRFYLTMGLVLFVLLIFMVTGPMMATLTPGGAPVRTEMSWIHPSKGRQAVDTRAFLIKKRELASYISLTQGRSQTPTNEDVAFWMMMDELARDAGIRVSDEELAEFLVGFVPDDRRAYQELMRARGTTIRQFEETLRSQQRIRRYRSFLAESMSKPSPEEVSRRWMNEHQEYAFDYVEAEVAGFAEEARANLPDDAELQAWFEALPENRRNTYRTPEKVRAELVYFPLPIEEGAAAKLLEAYPRPEIEDPEDLAEQYHTSFAFTRFKRETPLELSPEDQQNAERVRDSFAFPYEEVAEESRREAPVYYSFDDWQKEITRREGEGEEIDLAAEAARIGAEFMEVGPLTQQELTELEGVGGRSLASSIIRAPDGKLAPRVTLEPVAMVTGRVLERVPPAMPEFSEIRDTVADAWAEERAESLALERLEAVRTRLAEADETVDPVRPEVSHEAFVAAAEAEGFEVQRRDWAERRPLGSPSPAYRFFRGTESLYTLREEEVSPPLLGPQGEYVFLVRQAGLRDPDPSRMSPSEVEAARQEAQASLLEEFNRKNLNSQSWFAQNYGFEHVWTEEENEAP